MLIDNIYKNLKNNIQTNAPNNILLAISGGVDSIVLLDVLDKIKCRYKILSNISLVYINYLTNSNSLSREKLCLKLSKKYKYPLIIRKSYLESENFESNARNERYRYLKQISEINQTNFILTAHHKDDQIETLLMKYYDKSDWISYLGIREKYNKIVRPMLEIYKNEILSYAKDNKLFWIDDPSNTDISFRRNKIRHIDLPNIYQDNLQLIDKLFSMHFDAKDKFNKISNKIDHYDKQYIEKKSNDFLVISNNSDSISDPVVFKLFYQHILENYLNHSVQNTKGFWSSLFDFIYQSKTGSQFILDRYFTIIKDRKKHYIYRNTYLDKKNNIKIDKKDNINHWYDTQIVTSRNSLGEDLEVIDIIKIPYKKFNDGIYIRNWKHGDKCYNSSKNIKNIFTDNKISLFDKMTYPIITDTNDKIICIPKLYNYYAISNTCKTIYWTKKK